MVTGILLITITVLHAKSINSFKTLISTAVPGSNYEELVNKLAADNDFKNYYISNVEFANKVIESKAGSLFLKYIQNSITVNEEAELLVKMNVSKKEFNAIGAKLKNEALTFMQRFPELKLRSEKEQKQLLVNAFKKISTDYSVVIKFSKAKNITMEECFWSWAACNTLCAISCSYNENYSACMWQCGAICGGAYGFCWFLAE